MFAVVDTVNVVFFAVVILGVILGLCTLCIAGIVLSRRSDSVSPYSRLPMRMGSELSYDAKEKVLRFLYNMHQYDNRIIEFKTSAVCRETGRIFPNAVTWYEKIRLDWSFLQKRYPGKYVSWGSLTTDQKEIVRAAHHSLGGFQIDFSSPNPQPSAIEPKYAFAKPGPLYVDIDTNVLLGWQSVPDTDLEVLVVQKPFEVIMLSVSQLDK